MIKLNCGESENLIIWIRKETCRVIWL